MKIGSSGYSLIELLIVLSLLTVMTGVVLVSYEPLYRGQEEKYFIKQLENDIYYAQQLAISTGTTTNVIINNQQKFYGVSQQNKLVFTRNFDEHISFQRGTLLLNDVTYRQNGNISKAGTIFITIGEQRYMVVFQIGKGRFYIEKI